MLKIALAQINPTIGDLTGNSAKIKQYLNKALQAGADLLICPELAVTGYPPKDLLCRKEFLQEVNRVVERDILPFTDGIGLILGAPVEGDGEDDLYNSAIVMENGKIISVHDKTLLPNYDVFDEKRYFKPGLIRMPIVFRDLVLGVTVCEDIWNDKDYWHRQKYDIDPVQELVDRRVNILINIAASPYHYGKQSQRIQIMQQLAQKYGLDIVYVNQVGGNDELIFDGCSMVVSKTGNVVRQAKSFAEDFFVFEIDDLHRINIQAGNNMDEYRKSVGADVGAFLSGQATGTESIGSIHEALVLGIRDYISKIGFSKALIGLSGGIDSAVTAALAVAALGKENVLGVAMPSRYSSEGSKSDAGEVAANLGIAFRVVPVENMFDAFLTVFNQGENPLMDLAEENIQARIRGSILMFISNREGYFVLTTGNKSETAVGYCTLYGDMCGSLAVIGDVPKVMVYELARYINRNGEVIPETTIIKAPSAELRPDQLDQDSLPPYDVLDEIIRLYVEDGKSSEEIVTLGYGQMLVENIVRKINAAEYKRQQAAPTLKVTSKAFGSGRRMPVVQRWCR